MQATHHGQQGVDSVQLIEVANEQDAEDVICKLGKYGIPAYMEHPEIASEHGHFAEHVCVFVGLNDLNSARTVVNHMQLNDLASDIVDEASRESFPCSDSPAFNQ